ncbi:transcription elongation factor GreAB (plasmid) [Azospirillum humicireducens]|uniref:Transcription elongation factor GreAB n=1 Tax=Azospirillum humicireducens TaxID=1226968 RepID=A0A2R4VRI5_9PROT|nr:GreA/GreB family elongation factor [Azospirillum humicireducens]AWB07059.1 transcription elongation factor GreAB [Azospirillum humicireducens]
MSRAFVKESDAETEGPLPQVAGPLHVSAATVAAWQSELAAADAEIAKLRGSDAPEDRQATSSAKRRVDLLRARLAAAVVVRPAGSVEEAGFGSVVVAEDENGRRWTFALVGGEEADPAAGRISWQSPLGEALVGGRVGDLVEWPRRDGALPLTIRSVSPG